MSKFYGTVKGSANTTAGRGGSSDIRVAAQTWDHSIITILHYDKRGNLCVDIETADGSAVYGTTVWSGTYEQFLEQLRK